jgi:UDP-2,3-diacylglucosamine hydrolase
LEDLARDQALLGLAEFRQGGGSLSILPGNHDRWLVSFYEASLGASILAEPVEVETYGLKIHIVHGHLLGARRLWKAAMESREFFRAFGAIPDPAAKSLDLILEARNRRGLADDEQRHLAVFRGYADRLEGVDLAVFGHVHRAVDQPGSPRMIVLGGWQKRISFLKVDDSGADFHVESSDVDEATPPDPRRAKSSNATP